MLHLKSVDSVQASAPMWLWAIPVGVWQKCRLRNWSIQPAMLIQW